MDVTLALWESCDTQNSKVARLLMDRFGDQPDETDLVSFFDQAVLKKLERIK